MAKGHPLQFKEPKRLLEKIKQYFVEAKENKEPITLATLAVYLGTTRRLLKDYKDNRKGFQAMIEYAKAECEAYASRQLFRHNGQVAGIIFNLKNNYEWEDVQEIKGVGTRIINITLCSAAEMEKYKKNERNIIGS